MVNLFQKKVNLEKLSLEKNPQKELNLEMENQESQTHLNITIILVKVAVSLHTTIQTKEEEPKKRP